MNGRFTVKYAAAMLVLMSAACSGVYYSALEKIGIPKRELLVDRIEAAQTSQEEAKKQFKDALERFRSVVSFDGGDLEKKYETLSAELHRSETKANAVRNRIRAVEDVADALFDEWEDELGKYSNASLRASSAGKLADTKARYAEMNRAMKRAESKLEPVLRPLRDNVLFLKHNLNARAVDSLSGELREVEGQVDELVAGLERSIAESARFIETLK